MTQLAVSAQETRAVNGRVVSESFESLPIVKIFDRDTTLLGQTDLDGYFNMQLPIGTQELLLGFVGFEWMNVIVGDDCDTIEMIVMNSVIYDFMPMKKLNRKRLKRFKRLPERHKEAHEKGMFRLESTCVSYIFNEH